MKKLAFIKYNGMSSGGTEKWLQQIAANLPKDIFDITYFYCDNSKYVNSDYKSEGTNADRLKYMIKNNIKLVEFKVEAKDITTPLHKWLNTNFFDLFNENDYDIIITAKAGPTEYPYYLMNKPIIELVSLNAGVDYSKNIIHSIHLSDWQRYEWILKGGNANKSSVSPITVNLPVTKDNFRKKFNIPIDAVVLGFHQRNDDNIFSDVPINAFFELLTKYKDIHFVMLGGSNKYKIQSCNNKSIHFIEHNAKPHVLSKFLNTLDIYTHGRADGETFGTVLAEAMIHKLPIVTHSSLKGANAHKNTIANGGFFVNTLKEYVKCTESLILNKKARRVMGNKGYKYATTNYTIFSTMLHFVDVLNNVAIVPRVITHNVTLATKLKYNLYSIVFKNYLLYDKIISLTRAFK